MQMRPDQLLRQYQTMGLQGLVESASPHDLIRMLLDGCLERVAVARGQMAQNDLAGKGASISKAITIIEGLRTSLNKDVGGDVAQNLESLYDYMNRQLLIANATNDAQPLTQVEGLLAQIREAWVAIGPDVSKKAS